MLRNIFTCLLSLTAMVLSLDTVRAATVYDLAADYSTTINTNSSTWSYRRGGSHNGSYNLLDLAPTAGGGFAGPWSPGATPSVTEGWQLTGSSVIPFLGKNTTGGTETFLGGGTFVWPNGKVMVHPDSDDLVVVSWLAPANGTADIDYRIQDAHLGGGASSGIVYYVDKNAGIGPDGLATAIVPEAGDSGLLSLSGVSVNAGDRINFVVGLEFSLNANATFVDATINFTETPPAPEPSSLWLAGLGMIVVARRIRRRRAC